MSSKGFQFKYLYNGYDDLCEGEDHVEICMDGEIGLFFCQYWIDCISFVYIYI